MQSLEWIDVVLEQDDFYAAQKSQALEGMARDDRKQLDAIPLTLRNMDLEAAYRAGFKDGLAYAKRIEEM